MSVDKKTVLSRAIVAITLPVSALLAIVGLGLIAMYFWEGVISRWGEADQSLLFWYLPVLFIGILSFAGGVGFVLVAFKKFKQ